MGLRLPSFDSVFNWVDNLPLGLDEANNNMEPMDATERGPADPVHQGEVHTQPADQVLQDQGLVQPDGEVHQGEVPVQSDVPVDQREMSAQSAQPGQTHETLGMMTNSEEQDLVAQVLQGLESGRTFRPLNLELSNIVLGEFLQSLPDRAEMDRYEGRTGDDNVPEPDPDDPDDPDVPETPPAARRSARLRQQGQGAPPPVTRRSDRIQQQEQVVPPPASPSASPASMPPLETSSESSSSGDTGTSATSGGTESDESYFSLPHHPHGDTDSEEEEEVNIRSDRVEGGGQDPTVTTVGTDPEPREIRTKVCLPPRRPYATLNFSPTEAVVKLVIPSGFSSLRENLGIEKLLSAKQIEELSFAKIKLPSFSKIFDHETDKRIFQRKLVTAVSPALESTRVTKATIVVWLREDVSYSISRMAKTGLGGINNIYATKVSFIDAEKRKRGVKLIQDGHRMDPRNPHNYDCFNNNQDGKLLFYLNPELRNRVFRDDMTLAAKTWLKLHGMQYGDLYYRGEKMNAVWTNYQYCQDHESHIITDFYPHGMNARGGAYPGRNSNNHMEGEDYDMDHDGKADRHSI